MQKPYIRPELEIKQLISMEMMAATESGDNDFDLESDAPDWGDLGG